MLAQHHLPSSPTKCSSMLCHFSSHLPGLSFVYALMHLFTLAPLRSMPKQGLLLCCFPLLLLLFISDFLHQLVASRFLFALHSTQDKNTSCVCKVLQAAQYCRFLLQAKGQELCLVIAHELPCSLAELEYEQMRRFLTQCSVSAISGNHLNSM